MAVITSKLATLMVFLTISYYNVLELNALIFTTFKSWRGLYFWSCLAATWGIAFNATGFLLKDLQITHQAYVYATFVLVGWVPMVTGQSVVLYSRLHLVLHNKKRLRMVLYMIIGNALWLHLPTIVLVYGVSSTHPARWKRPYEAYEKLQLTVFFLQEIIISGLYVVETTKLLKLEKTIGRKRAGLMNHLIYVNILVILLDITTLSLEYANLYDVQTIWKPLAYSVKLKLEFSILNRLVELTGNARSNDQTSRSRTKHTIDEVALDNINRRSVTQGDDKVTSYEVHVSNGKDERDNFQHQNSTVLMTTEFQVSNSRRKNSRGSLADSDVEILAESVTHEERASSDIVVPRYGH